MMQICDVVIYLQFARDAEDFSDKLSLSSTAFKPRESVCESGYGGI